MEGQVKFHHYLLTSTVPTHICQTHLSKATKQNQIKSCDEHEQMHRTLNQLRYKTCHILLTSYHHLQPSKSYHWNVCHILRMIATMMKCLPYLQHECHTLGMFAKFWAWLPHCGHVCHVLNMIATLCTCLPHCEYDCHTVDMFLALLPHYGNVCHLRSMIATHWECLPHFEPNCHTVCKFATFWA